MLRRALGVDVKVAKADRVNSLGVEPFTPHDMRRSLATWLGENQVSEKVHDRMLNHYRQTIAAVYNTAKYNKPAREWWLKWGEHIQGLMAENVVPLRGKK
jgi:integrase